MNEMAMQMDKLVAEIARNLVDSPDDVYVRAMESDHTMFLELRVAKEDVGKVIGRQGRTAQALRVLVGAVASKANKHTILEILE